MKPIRFYLNEDDCEFAKDFYCWTFIKDEDYGRCGGGGGCKPCHFQNTASCSSLIKSVFNTLSFETNPYIIIDNQTYPELFI